MQFSVEQLRSVRNNYLEPPYPGFSLDEVCCRRRMAQTKLVRGENAWTAKGSAQTTEEWVQRLIQGSLNKMSDRNFDLLMERLRIKELFSTRENMSIVVSIIFRKALDEPENSKLYAAVCHSLASFEVTLTERIHGEKPSSKLRDAIVDTAQKEFKAFRRVESVEDKSLSEEDREFLRVNFMRRKKANIRFVGELFLHEVLSYRSILSVAKILMGVATEGGYPETENIELLAELFQTVGEVLDTRHRDLVDHHCDLLAGLIKKQDNPYPHRIRFKIMDLLDLRKCGWGARPKVVVAAAAPRSSGTKKAVAPSPPSPAPKKGKADGASSSWRDTITKKDQGGASGKSNKGTKPQGGSPSGGEASPPSSSLASRAVHADVSSSEAPAPAQKSVKFELRVQSLFQEWVSDFTNDFIPEWIEEFNNCDRVFNSVDDLCVAVAMEVIKGACTTTRKEAQREACSFLIVGLYLKDMEMFGGFSGALAAAVEDGLLEDVPKFPERLMHMVRLSSSEDDINADVYYDAANVLCMAYNQLSDPDEYTVDTLMEFWAKVPRPSPDSEEEDRVSLNFPVIYSLCENPNAKPGLEKLISAIIGSLNGMGIVDDVTIDELLTTEVDTNPLYGKIVAAYKAA